MSRDILGRLSIEVLLATVIVREDMDGMLFQGVGNGVGSLEVKCDSWPARCKFHGTSQRLSNKLRDNFVQDNSRP
jgi:hypothetical protein